jgi:dUTP pyrophosphatase
MILEYSKTRAGAQEPVRANPSDAGLDVFYCPEDPTSIVSVLQPGESGIFSTGLRFGVPHGYMLEVKNRSGNAAKRHLLVGACVVDSGYDGEVFINLHNVGTKPQFIEAGMKIAQVVLIPVVHFKAMENRDGNLYDYPMTISNRGDGALGSTDVGEI